MVSKAYQYLICIVNLFIADSSRVIVGGPRMLRAESIGGAVVGFWIWFLPHHDDRHARLGIKPFQRLVASCATRGFG